MKFSVILITKVNLNPNGCLSIEHAVPFFEDPILSKLSIQIHKFGKLVNKDPKIPDIVDLRRPKLPKWADTMTQADSAFYWIQAYIVFKFQKYKWKYSVLSYWAAKKQLLLAPTRWHGDANTNLWPLSFELWRLFQVLGLLYAEWCCKKYIYCYTLVF